MEKQVTTIGDLMKFLKQQDAETVDKLAKILGAGADISANSWESQNERENEKQTKTESKNEKKIFTGDLTIKDL